MDRLSSSRPYRQRARPPRPRSLLGAPARRRAGLAQAPTSARRPAVVAAISCIRSSRGLPLFLPSFETPAASGTTPAQQLARSSAAASGGVHENCAGVAPSDSGARFGRARVSRRLRRHRLSLRWGPQASGGFAALARRVRGHGRFTSAAPARPVRGGETPARTCREDPSGKPAGARGGALSQADREGRDELIAVRPRRVAHFRIVFVPKSLTGPLAVTTVRNTSGGGSE